MGTIDEIKRMLGEGKPELRIREFLKERGITDKEVSDLMSQAKIKEAVSSTNGENNEMQAMPPLPEKDENGINEDEQELPEVPTPTDKYAQGNVRKIGESYIVEGVQSNKSQKKPVLRGYDKRQLVDESDGEMQPSMSVQEQEYVGGNYSEDQSYETYPQYQPYQDTMSSDVITEITEQVVSEKLSFLRDKLEKTIDFKTDAETKISSLDRRLRRIEQILDRLQLSIMQKVGDYVTDVGDIKRELEETQKSFKALVPKLRGISYGHGKYKEHRDSHKKHEHKKKVP